LHSNTKWGKRERFIHKVSTQKLSDSQR
jgi:hypothetical protein